MINNAIVNDTTIECFRRNSTLIENTMRGSEFMHVRYVTHILNFVVVDELKEVDR